MYSNYQLILLACFPLTYVDSSSAVEVINNSPGVRATGMAGIFVAAANDSTAIWYNPAGLAGSDSAKLDSTISISQADVSTNISDRSSIAEDYSKTTKTAIGYAGLSVKGVGRLTSPLVGTVENRFDANAGSGGVAYYHPYTLTVNVDAPINPQSTLTFGHIEAKYNELMLAYSNQIEKTWSYGVALEGVWLDIKCLQFEFCVDNGPWGLGLTLGTLYEQSLDHSTRISYGLVWHSKVSIDYLSKPDSGIGAVLGQYIPDRPASVSMGASIKNATPRGVVNANIELGYVWWSQSIAHANPLSDYRYYGVSAEWILPLAASAVAVRLGVKQNEAESNTLQTDFLTLAGGLGLSLAERHFLDMAYQTRNMHQSNEKIQRFSASYSYQF